MGKQVIRFPNRLLFTAAFSSMSEFPGPRNICFFQHICVPVYDTELVLSLAILQWTKKSALYPYVSCHRIGTDLKVFDDSSFHHYPGFVIDISIDKKESWACKKICFKKNAWICRVISFYKLAYHLFRPFLLPCFSSYEGLYIPKWSFQKSAGCFLMVTSPTAFIIYRQPRCCYLFRWSRWWSWE